MLPWLEVGAGEQDRVFAVGVRHPRLGYPRRRAACPLLGTTSGTFSGSAVTDEWAEAAPLAVSEVVTNAVVHSGGLVVVEA